MKSSVFTSGFEKRVSTRAVRRLSLMASVLLAAWGTTMPASARDPDDPPNPPDVPSPAVSRASRASPASPIGGAVPRRSHQHVLVPHERRGATVSVAVLATSPLPPAVAVVDETRKRGRMARGRH